MYFAYDEKESENQNLTSKLEKYTQIIKGKGTQKYKLVLRVGCGI